MTCSEFCLQSAGLQSRHLKSSYSTKLFSPLRPLFLISLITKLMAITSDVLPARGVRAVVLEITRQSERKYPVMPTDNIARYWSDYNQLSIRSQLL